MISFEQAVQIIYDENGSTQEEVAKEVVEYVKKVSILERNRTDENGYTLFGIAVEKNFSSLPTMLISEDVIPTVQDIAAIEQNIAAIGQSGGHEEEVYRLSLEFIYFFATFTRAYALEIEGVDSESDDFIRKAAQKAYGKLNGYFLSAVKNAQPLPGVGRVRAWWAKRCAKKLYDKFSLSAARYLQLPEENMKSRHGRSESYTACYASAW